MLQREARAPHGGAEQLPGTRQLSPVPNLRDRPAGPPYRGDGQARGCRLSGRADRLAGRVDDRAVVTREDQRQAGVVNALGQRVLQRFGVRGGRQYLGGDLAGQPAGAQRGRRHAARHQHDDGALRQPDRAGRHVDHGDRLGERIRGGDRGQQCDGRAADRDRGVHQADDPWCPQPSPRGQDGQARSGADGEGQAPADQAGPQVGRVIHRRQVGRARETSAGLRVE